jgi:branched-chain amino acid transport system permease protein
MSFTLLMQLIISGVAMGFIYALVSIEYTLIYNSTSLLNFSHDKLIMMGAYIFAGQFVLRMGCNYVIATLATILTMFLLGVLIAKGIFNPMRNMSSPIFAVIGTVIMGRILKEVARLVWGATAFTIPGFLKGTVKINGIVITRANLIIIIVSIAIVAILQFFFYRTKAGKAMRCVQQNKTAATLMGIDVERNIDLTIALSAVICAIIGILVISLFSVSLTMANMIALKGFAAGVVGGFGYFPGTIVGGIVIGVVENLSTLVIPSLYKDCVSFALLIIFLLFRPQGILGKKKD